MALSDVRDLVLVVWGTVSILLVVIRLLLAAGFLYFGRKGVRKLGELIDDKAKPGLDKALDLARKIEERTSRLPGAPGSLGGPAELVTAVQDLKAVEPPFRSRKRTWLPFIG